MSRRTIDFYLKIVMLHPFMSLNAANNRDLEDEEEDLVRRRAKKFAYNCNAPHLFDDFYQAGMVGLLEARGKFDKTKGEDFDTFARDLIDKNIQEELRHGSSTIKVTNYAQNLGRRVEKIFQMLTNILNRKPTYAEIGIVFDHYEKLKKAAAKSLEQQKIKPRPPAVAQETMRLLAEKCKSGLLRTDSYSKEKLEKLATTIEKIIITKRLLFPVDLDSPGTNYSDFDSEPLVNNLIRISRDAIDGMEDLRQREAHQDLLGLTRSAKVSTRDSACLVLVGGYEVSGREVAGKIGMTRQGVDRIVKDTMRKVQKAARRSL